MTRTTIRCFLVFAFVALASVAQAGSVFEFVLDPDAVTGPQSGTASAILTLRETFDGVDSELFDGTDGPGLFSFSVGLDQGTSTSGSASTIKSVTLDPAFALLVSGIDPDSDGAHTSVELNGAIDLGALPITVGSSTGAAQTLEIPIATIDFNVSPIEGDITEFVTRPHSAAGVFLTLDGTGSTIDVSHGTAGSVVSEVPEPAAWQLALAGLILLIVFRQRSAMERA